MTPKSDSCDAKYAAPLTIIVRPNPQTMVFQNDYIYLGMSSKLSQILKVRFKLVLMKQ